MTIFARDVLAAVRKLYAADAVILTEVPNSTGLEANRRMDAIAIGCWPSRGLYIHAIEIKVSRTDLRKELRTPEKTDAIAAYCDEFYLATPAGLVKDADPVPARWGLISVGEDGVAKRDRTSAPINPPPISRGFLAAIARSVAKEDRVQSAVAEALHESQRDAHDRAEKAVASELKGLRHENDRLHEEIDRYRRALGRYTSPEGVGAAVAIVERLRRRDEGALPRLELGLDQMLRDLRQLRVLATQFVEPVEATP